MNTVTRAVNWRAVGFFVLISFGLAYALDAVLLSTLGLAHPLAIVPISLRMFTPLIATVIVCRFITFEKWTGAAGLGRESFANGQWKKIVSSVLIGFVLVVSVIAASIALATAAGWLNPDWEMTQTRAPLIEAGADISPTVLIVMTVIQIGRASCRERV